MKEMTPEVCALLRDASSWRLLALLFTRPDEGWASHVRSVASDLSDDPDLVSLAETCAGEGNEAMFLAIVGPGGAASAREIAYRRMGDPGRTLAELRILYDTFAFTSRSEEPPDHVSVETDFVGFLRLRRAYALHLEDLETVRSLRDAEELFISEHLVYLAAGLESRLSESYLSGPVAYLAERLGPFEPHVIESATRPMAAESDVPTCGLA